MTAQLSLYDSQLIGASHNGTPTSIAAAQSIAEHAPTLKGRVLAYLREHGPATQERISIETGIRLSTICARVNELAREGRVRDTGETARTTSGRLAVVWEAGV